MALIIFYHKNSTPGEFKVLSLQQKNSQTKQGGSESKSLYKRREWQKTKRLDSITDSMDMNLSKFQEIVEDKDQQMSV